MSIIAAGYEARSDYIDKNATDSSTSLAAAIQKEIDNDAQLKDAKFKDTKMQEVVLSYLNILDDQLEVVQNNQYGSASYYEAFEPVYNTRTKILKTMVDDYGLAVGTKYQDSFNELIANGSSVQKKEAADEAINGLIAGATWEPVDEGYGSVTYTAIVENTTDYNFSDVSLTVNLYDSDDVKTENYASANTWNKGEKVKFEVYVYNEEVVRIDATVSYYTVSE